MARYPGISIALALLMTPTSGVAASALSDRRSQSASNFDIIGFAREHLGQFMGVNQESSSKNTAFNEDVAEVLRELRSEVADMKRQHDKQLNQTLARRNGLPVKTSAATSSADGGPEGAVAADNSGDIAPNQTTARKLAELPAAALMFKQDVDSAHRNVLKAAVSRSMDAQSPLMSDGGLQVVSALNSQHAMQAYLRKVLEAEGKIARDAGALSQFAKYLNTGNANMNFTRLHAELFSAPWIVDKIPFLHHSARKEDAPRAAVSAKDSAHAAAAAHAAAQGAERSAMPSTSAAEDSAQRTGQGRNLHGVPGKRQATKLGWRRAAEKAFGTTGGQAGDEDALETDPVDAVAPATVDSFSADEQAEETQTAPGFPHATKRAGGRRKLQPMAGGRRFAAHAWRRARASEPAESATFKSKHFNNKKAWRAKNEVAAQRDYPNKPRWQLRRQFRGQPKQLADQPQWRRNPLKMQRQMQQHRPHGSAHTKQPTQVSAESAPEVVVQEPAPPLEQAAEAATLEHLEGAEVPNLRQTSSLSVASDKGTATGTVAEGMAQLIRKRRTGPKHWLQAEVRERRKRRHQTTEEQGTSQQSYQQLLPEGHSNDGAPPVTLALMATGATSKTEEVQRDAEPAGAPELSVEHELDMASLSSSLDPVDEVGPMLVKQGSHAETMHNYPETQWWIKKMRSDAH